MTRRGRRPRKKGAAAPAVAPHYTWLKPLKARPPEPFFDSGATLARLCPETALLCAVLEDAFACYYGARDPDLAEETRRWFFTDDAAALFSFVSLCEALGLDAPDIRQRLAAGHPVTVAAVLRKAKKAAPSRTHG
jgi:hypothetical protein